MDAEEYFDEMVEKRELQGADIMPYQVIWNKDSKYSDKFPKKVDVKVSKWNLMYLDI